MACCFISDKPLPEPVLLNYCGLNFMEKLSQIESNTKLFFEKKNNLIDSDISQTFVYKASHFK